MSYILISNVAPLLSKYRVRVSNGLKEALSEQGLPTTELDMIDWFEWSFNHILKEFFYTNVRNHSTVFTYENIFRQMESEYIQTFLACIDQGNHRILKSISEFLTLKAVLTNETLIMVASPKIEL